MFILQLILGDSGGSSMGLDEVNPAQIVDANIQLFFSNL